jgi:hypothetical protein
MCTVEDDLFFSHRRYIGIYLQTHANITVMLSGYNSEWPPGIHIALLIQILLQRNVLLNRHCHNLFPHHYQQNSTNLINWFGI